MYIDGTKFEANANRYTFVWRGSINYHLVGLLDKIDALYSRYNTLITEQRYDRKYGLQEKTMFVIDGIDKVREIIEKNRERKINNKKKISNNKILEMDNMPPLDLLRLQMKDDRMLNGQLKLGYNVQIAVENYFVIHTYVSNDRTDYDTLIPALRSVTLLDYDSCWQYQRSSSGTSDFGTSQVKTVKRLNTPMLKKLRGFQSPGSKQYVC